MTAIEYMKKQAQKHSQNYVREAARGVPEEMLHNIALKVGYYEAAVEALMAGWISVEDRLPDEEGLYLTWDKANSYGISWFDMRSLSKYTWQHEITHWMPLPEPPKKEGDGNG